ncbi:antibiotic biosynthesis monooxygenase [Vibrio metoecus]|uniref:putative quinol monooxygenase n=1 Tax=Vibrio metoecus TaxID=1481663 RepID=UPI0006D7E064|nr:putative quinol monooxygenase [Vibrio metoecus]KQB02679.1 antibiotic biosynthesis monooxygenase [Vibrio metoecus]KQB05331.1 antibiotic biosynthesis monooxygenase [Vibrio metoecus]PAR49492.1 antibiotic biosynthesis monooxygenase [Vibrio metoecus]PAR57685.1 antibiotic biosynthesis monooxygenase [Vibrio metoecus]PAR68439.1 antibiotic biosynthesis monooxygenase [Vibrio metoecus]
MIHLTATLHAKTAHIPTVRRLAQGMLMPTRQEAGCLRYDLFEQQSKQGVFLFQEQFVDQAAFEHHCQSSYFQQFIADLAGLLMAEPEIQFYSSLSE